MTKLLVALLLVATSTCGALASDKQADDLVAELGVLRQEIRDAEEMMQQYGDGAIRTIINLRIETLRATEALLNQFELARRAGASFSYVIPAVQPDPERAEAILLEIANVSQGLEQARAEVESAGGLVQAMELMAVATRENSLALLKHHYYVYRYGLFGPIDVSATKTTPNTLPNEEEGTTDAAASEPAKSDPSAQIPQPAWADPSFPDIDYATSFYDALHDEDDVAVGRWIIKFSNAAIDDSPIVLAMNLEPHDSNMGLFDKPSMLMMRCEENTTGLVVGMNEYFLSMDDELVVEYRIGSRAPVTTRWPITTNSEFVGIWRNDAISFIRGIVGEEKLYVRVTERDGSRVSATFDLRGMDRAASHVAKACNWSLG